MSTVGYRVAVLILLAACLGGCTSSDAEPTPAGGKPSAPLQDDGYEKIRSGCYQLGQAQDTVLAAYEATEKIDDPTLAELKEELLETLDAIGSDLSKYREAPNKEEFAKDLPKYRRFQGEAIILANDSVIDLNSLRGAVSDMASVASDENLREQLTTIDVLLEEGVDTLISAIQAYGGSMEQTAPEEGS